MSCESNGFNCLGAVWVRVRLDPPKLEVGDLYDAIGDGELKLAVGEVETMRLWETDLVKEEPLMS